MAQQTLIIGLGQFGMPLALSLSHHGSEVIAVDVNESQVNLIAPHVGEAILLDAMDEESLASIAPAQRDICVCAIGEDNREGSIIVTALLRQLGAKHIIARATDDLHARILSLVGAHEVVNPERDYSDRLAVRIAWRHVVNVLPLGGNLVLTEVEAPESLWGRTLLELQLPKRYSVIVSAIRSKTSGGLGAEIPDPHKPIQQGDILMLVSTEQNARNFTERT